MQIKKYTRLSMLWILTAMLLWFVPEPSSAGGEEKKAEFAKDTAITTEGHLFSITYKIPDKSLLEERVFWLVVRPKASPGSVWLQGAELDLASSTEFVYLGTDIPLPRPEEFQIRLVSFPKGTELKVGELKLPIARGLKMQTHAVHVIQRLK